MSVSLFTVGNTHLGKASPVKLSELNTADSETRTYSSTANYRRVNSIEQGRNRAPASATTTPEQLSDWKDGSGNPYVQWDTDANRGTAFKLTAGTTQADCGPGDECAATFTWTKPTDYEDFPSGVVQQTLWVTPCSSNTQVGCESDNPFAGNVILITEEFVPNHFLNVCLINLLNFVAQKTHLNRNQNYFDLQT